MLGEGNCGIVDTAEQEEPVHRRVALKTGARSSKSLRRRNASRRPRRDPLFFPISPGPIELIMKGHSASESHSLAIALGVLSSLHLSTNDSAAATAATP